MVKEKATHVSMCARLAAFNGNHVKLPVEHKRDQTNKPERSIEMVQICKP